MSLEKKETEKYKKELLKEKENLEERLDNLKEDLDYGDDVDSGETESDESEAYSNYFDVKNNLEHRLGHINDALKKIEKGTYGICEECGSEISKDVLGANPSSVLCKECKKKT